VCVPEASARISNREPRRSGTMKALTVEAIFRSSMSFSCSFAVTKPCRTFTTTSRSVAPGSDGAGIGHATCTEAWLTRASTESRFSRDSCGGGGGFGAVARPRGMGPKYFSTRARALARRTSPTMLRTALSGPKCASKKSTTSGSVSVSSSPRSPYTLDAYGWLEP